LAADDHDVADKLVSRIAAGEFRPGDQLPVVSSLAAEYGVSRATIDRALRKLVTEGLISVRSRRGIFVKKRHIVMRDLGENLRLEFGRALAGDMSEGIFEAMTGEGNVQVASTYATVVADERVAEHLDVPAGQPLLERTFRFVIDGDPFQIARSYMSTDLAARAGLTSSDVEVPGTSTLLQLISAGIAVQDALFTIEARMPTRDEAKALAMPPGVPVVEMWRILKVDGRPVEATKSVIHSDMVGYYFNVQLRGGPE
jgi:GntR family transcriptional regulator